MKFFLKGIRMQHLLPNMNYQERMARAQQKRQAILKFLAHGEVSTTRAIVARLLKTSEMSADRTLQSLVRDGCLKTEQHMVNSRKIQIFGITSHGLALADQPDGKEFELGRTNSSYIYHHLQTQHARLQAEEAGWQDWTPGKILYNQNFLKVPDALGTRPDGVLVALEIERHIKSKKRYESIISAHLQNISQKKFSEVHYLCEEGLHTKVKAIFNAIQYIPVKGERVRLEQKHRDRFKFFDLKNWPTEDLS